MNNIIKYVGTLVFSLGSYFINSQVTSECTKYHNLKMFIFHIKIKVPKQTSGVFCLDLSNINYGNIEITIIDLLPN